MSRIRELSEKIVSCNLALESSQYVNTYGWTKEDWAKHIERETRLVVDREDAFIELEREIRSEKNGK